MRHERTIPLQNGAACAPILIGWGLILLLWSIDPGRLAAQGGWDVSPYRIQCWIATDPAPEAQDAWTTQSRELVRLMEARWGPLWDFACPPVSPGMVTEMLGGLDRVPVHTLASGPEEEALGPDKLFLVAIHVVRQGYRVEACELDRATRRRSATISQEVPTYHRLAMVVDRLIARCFRPLGMITRVTEKTCLVTMRSGLLSVEEDSPIMPSENEILVPILRKNDRSGQLVEGGIQIVDWTMLRVTGRDRAAAECEIVTGVRSPIRSRSTRRVERYALLARPASDDTLLQLRSRLNPEKGLAGYDVYRKTLEGEATEFVGRTDWRGTLRIDRNDDNPLALYYVKNGNAVLARLPMMPGFVEKLDATLPDDSARLEAEGFLTGVQERLVDLVARRQVLAARIRRRIEQKKWDEANELFDELRLLEGRQQLSRRLQDRQQSLSSEDRAVQKKIDRLFSDTYAMLAKFLDPSFVEKIREEINVARQ